MTRKQIEQMREARLWLKEVVVPMAGIAALLADKDIRRNAAQKAGNVVNGVRNYFEKEN